MKNIFRNIALLIIASMVMMCMAVATAEDMEVKTYTEPQQALKAPGIMKGDENGNFNADANIKRCDFALVIARVMALETANVYDSGYEDVAPGTEYASAIGILSKMKIFGGFDNGRFYPNEPVMYDQAMKVMVSVLGYGYLAETKGGYPTGYLSYAAQLRLTDNVVAADNVMTRAMIAQLIYNALDVKLLTETGFGDSFSYGKTGDTLLSKYQDVTEIKGKLTANYYTGIAKISGSANGMVEINDIAYECELPEMFELLGHKVKAYVKDEKVIYIQSEVAEENIVVIEAEDILPETTMEKIVIEKGRKKETLDIEGASVIINGRLAANYNDSDFKPATGKVELIDANADDVYEIVKITSYETLTVSAGGADNIYFKYGAQPLNVETAKKAKYAVIKTEEGIVSMADYSAKLFPEDSVVTIARSRDGQIIDMEVSLKKSSGKIKTITEDNTVLLGDEEIKLTPECMGLIETGALDLSLGNDYFFNMDAFGRIASFKIQSGAKYAYLMNIAPNGELEEKLILKLLVPGGSKGEIKNFYAAEKLKINSAPYEGDLTSFRELYTGAGKIRRQLVRYTLNAADEVESFETALNEITETIGSDTNPDYNPNYLAERSDDFSATDRFQLDAVFGNYAYRGYNRSTLESTEFQINGDCVATFVAYANPDIPDELFCAYNGYSSIYKHDTYPGGTSYLYDINKDWATTAAVLVKESAGGTTGSETMSATTESRLYVEKIVPCLNNDGEPTYGIQDWGGSLHPAEDPDIEDVAGRWGSMYQGIALKDLVPGTVVQYASNDYGEIVEFRINYMPGVETSWREMHNDGNGEVAVDWAYASKVTAHGKIVRVTGDSVVYNANGTYTDIKDRDKNWDRHITPQWGFVMFDTVNQKWKDIPMSEVQPNDEVFIQIESGHWTGRCIVYR